MVRTLRKIGEIFEDLEGGPAITAMNEVYLNLDSIEKLDALESAISSLLDEQENILSRIKQEERLADDEVPKNVLSLIKEEFYEEGNNDE